MKTYILLIASLIICETANCQKYYGRGNYVICFNQNIDIPESLPNYQKLEYLKFKNDSSDVNICYAFSGEFFSGMLRLSCKNNKCEVTKSNCDGKLEICFDSLFYRDSIMPLVSMFLQDSIKTHRIYAENTKSRNYSIIYAIKIGNQYDYQFFMNACDYDMLKEQDSNKFSNEIKLFKVIFRNFEKLTNKKISEYCYYDKSIPRPQEH